MRSYLLKFLLSWSLWLPLLVTGQDLNGEIVSINHPNCTPPFIGSIEVLASDGVSPYNYTLDASIVQNNGSFSNLNLGDHSILINDAIGSTFEIVFEIVINNQLVINVIDLSHVNCFGDVDGSISVVASSGILPFEFSIDGGSTFQTSGNFLNLSAGTHEIIAIDGVGCYDTLNTEILALSHINILALNKENINCNGDSSGSIQLFGELGTSPYQFSMDGLNYQDSGVYSNIVVGDHQFWVEDVNGCMDSIALSFTEPPPIIMDSFSSISPICFNDNNAELSFNASGGVSPYTFQIDGSGAVSSPYFTGLDAGDHIVSMTDDNGCSIDSSIVIQQVDSLVLMISNLTLPLCQGGNDGSIELSASGGMGTYEYRIGTNSWSNTSIFSGLTAGLYDLQVKDQNDCISTLNYLLADQTELTVSIQNSSNVYCNISTNGSVELTAIGGVSPYTYSINGNPYQSSGLFTSLSSGNYSVVVLDYNGCTSSIDVEILETTNLSIDDIVVSEAICGGISTGEFTITSSGGLIPYQYSLDGGALQFSNVFSSVSIGMHTIELITSDGCSVSTTQYLGEVSPVVGIVLIQNDPLCEGAVDGSIQFSALGGLGPYNYSNDGGLNWQPSLFSGITDSTYVFSIVDQNLCTFDTTITFEEQNDLFISLTTISAAICPNSTNGSFEVIGLNGAVPYTYSLDGAPAVASNVFTGLSSGEHTVTLFDSNSCISDTIFSIDALEEPSINIDSLISPTCNGANDGVIQVSPNGTTTPYLYSINASPFSTTNYFSGLLAGTYTIEIQDVNSCLSSNDLTLTDIPTFSVNIDSITNVVCKNQEEGIIYYSFIGGLAPYFLRVNNGSWQNATNNLNSLFAGNYILDFMDSNGCIVSNIEQINEPATEVIVQILSIINVVCSSDSSGSVLAFATGGATPYQFSIDDVNYQSSGSFSNMLVGDYTMYAMDDYGCINSETFSIIANSPISLSWDSLMSPSCDLVENGYLDVAVISSSSPPYSFTLNNGAVQNSSIFDNLSEGVYVVDVQDVNGCSASIDTILTSISDLLIEVDSTQNIICVEDSSGGIWLNASGGTPEYSFYVDGVPLIGNGILGLNNGIYLTWVIDDVGCTDSTQVAVLQESLLQGSIFSQQNILCNNGDLGRVTINGTTGTSPYEYSIDGLNFSNNNYFDSLNVGDYTFIIQDASNCQTEVEVTIEELIELDLQINNIANPSCYGLNDGTLFLAVNNGIGPFMYSLDNGLLILESEFNDLGPGLHSAFVVDSQGCSDTLEFSMNEPIEIEISVDSIFNGSCFGSDDAYIDISSINAVGLVEYNLLPNNITNDNGLFENLSQGTYTLSVEDENGCTKDSIISIIPPSSIEMDIELINPLDCYLDSNAIIEISISGGISPYEYFIDSISNGSNQFINNLGSGTYAIMAIDQNNCQASLLYEVSEPDSIYLQYSLINDITCFGLNNGNVFFLANGGVGDFSYNLNGLIQDNGQYNNLTAGSYSLIVMDSSSCSMQYDFEINEPELLQLDSIIVQSPSCNGDTNGVLTFLVSGGSPVYNYFVPGIGSSPDSILSNLDAGAYYISVTDQNGCNTTQIVILTEPDVFELGLTALNSPLCYGDSTARVILQSSGGNEPSNFGLSWSSLDSSNTFNNLSSGLLNLYAEDIFGCKDSLTVYIPETEVINSSPTVQLPTCYGYEDAIVQFAAFGGSNSFEYSLDQVDWTNSGLFNDLAYGSHIFYIMDSNGCLKDTSIYIDQPEPLSINVLFVHPVTCSDPNSGSIDIEISGGSASYISYIGQDSLIGSLISFNNLGIGNYQIVSYDQNNCETSVDTSLVEIDSLNISVESVIIDCYGDNNGVATVSYSGGSGNYSIIWDNTTADESASTQPNLVAGVQYSVIVSDSLDENCTAVEYVTPIQPEEIIFEVYPFSSSCDPNEIWANIELISGGVEPFEFSMNNQPPINTSVFGDLSQVTTSFSVIDNDGCIEEQWIVPKNPNTISAYFEVSDDVVSMADGQVVFTDLSDNTESMKWDFGNNKSVEGLVSDDAIGDETAGIMFQPTHNYISYGKFLAKLTVFSDFGCDDSYEKTITVEEDNRVYIPNSFTPDGDGVNDIFKVYGSTVQERDFVLAVYDRSGEMIFQSFDKDIGWDGTSKKGNNAQSIVYVYMVSYYSGDRPYEKNGTVTLLR